ncbi:DUF2726 domain-containing protein [Stenotrophomonas sp. Leaf70]|uniref:DUF2726 domain-containing protein n=1 Tax=Stenotrophomonas sp. Leaf70 TaxID=1736233 RepID=UPI0012E15D5B|nr:DUF2726 domain-containing protein [Stenotrophomonas sp. Leaf70]
MNKLMATVSKSKDGCLSAFCDAVLRTEKIWSTDQFFEIFKAWVERGPREISVQEIADPQFQAYCKNHLAQRISSRSINQIKLLIQDVRTYQGRDQLADIRFGWDISKGSGRRIKTTALPPLQSAFTVSHVNEYIPHAKHCENLEQLLSLASKSHLEILFYKEWLRRYYSDDAPALIPEVHRFSLAGDSCGQRTFRYEDKNNIGHRGRIDFFVYNAASGKSLFIEIDGHEFHKTVEQRQVDAMKRNVCAEAGVPLKVFTTADIKDDLDGVFRQLDHVFKPST